MSIELHCNHCGKLVRAPDDAGGKHGKCPACHQSVYIPTPPDRIEPLSLEPVDPDFERRKARLMHETAELVGRIAREKEGPEKPGDRAERLAREEKAAAARATAAHPPARSTQPTLTASEAYELVVDYALAMFEGRLPEAEILADELRANLKLAEQAMQRIAVDEILPTKIEKVPRPLLLGFFKQLREPR